MPTQRRITDREALKGLAHPVRRQLYRLIRQTGPATVGQLAARIPLDPGLVSYHVRQLARWGYLAEVPELAKDRRERWWKVTSSSVAWSFMDFQDPEGRAIAETVKSQMVLDEFERLRAFERARDSWSEAWQESVASGEFTLRLTPADLAGLTRELIDVINRWAQNGHDGDAPAADSPDTGEPEVSGMPLEEGQEHVFLFFHSFPERL